MQPAPILDGTDPILVRDNRPNENVLDEVYRKYRNSHPFLPVTHFIDHSTMGSEALVALGLGHRVIDWISHHPVRAYEAPSTGVCIFSAWTAALGRKECHGDWLRHFDSALATDAIDDILAVWIER